MDIVILDKYIGMLFAGCFAALGGMANYIWQTMKPGSMGFTLRAFLGNLFLSFFIGLILGDLIPRGASGRDGMLMMCGFSSYAILEVLEVRGMSIFRRFWFSGSKKNDQ